VSVPPPSDKAPPLPSVGVVSLGCPKNLVDTEVMLGHLQRAGHAIVPDAEARVVLVNTCGFIDRAKEESVETILEQVERKRRGEIDRVVVAGCMVQKYGKELAAEIPEVDAFVGLDELELAPTAVSPVAGLPRFADKPLATRLYDERAPRASRRRGYVPEGREGCDSPCTFCDPADAGCGDHPSSRSSPRRSPRGAGRAGARPDLGDTTRYERTSACGATASRGSSASSREDLLSLDPLSTPTRPLDESIISVDSRRARRPLRRHPLRRLAPILAAMRRGELAVLQAAVDRMREIVPTSRSATFIISFPGEGEAEFAELCGFVRAAGPTTSALFGCCGAGPESRQLGDPVPAGERSAARSSCCPSTADRAAGCTPCAGAPSTRSWRPLRRHVYLVDARLRSQARRSTGAC
jgi:ribosomal protein S12 methylthiotransferase